MVFIAGRPKAALLFWFFGDFRCGALLFMVIHVIYKYKNRWRWLLNVRLACDHLFAVHLAVACDVYDGVFCAVLFPTRCLG